MRIGGVGLGGHLVYGLATELVLEQLDQTA